MILLSEISLLLVKSYQAYLLKVFSMILTFTFPGESKRSWRNKQKFADIRTSN